MIWSTHYRVPKFSSRWIFGWVPSIEIRSEDVMKTMFRIWYDHYVFLVMHFGLTNAPNNIYGLDE